MLRNEKVTPASRLGFIGLGHLGSPIARRLLAAGFPMVVYNRDPSKTTGLVDLGAQIAPDPGTLAASVDVVLSCLADGYAVDAVYFGEAGVLRAAKPGTPIIEMSTVAPETSRRLSRAAQDFGLPVIDLAVSGSTPAAEAGKLTLFGGGDREIFDAVQPLFPAIASQWFYMGPSGSGVAMKLVVNTLLGLGMQAIAEAVTLGSDAGLPRGLVFETLAKTAVVAPAHVGKLASAMRHDYSPQFPIRLMRKDFDLILSEARQFDVSMPATEVAAAVTAAEAARDGDGDFSAVIRLMESRAVLEKSLA